MKETLHKLRLSFSYAFDGLKFAYRTQLNMRVHIAAAFIVAVLTLFLPLSVTEILFVTAAVFVVIICELANTAVETVVDMVSPHVHPLAKIAKDIAAAAVLVSAFFALVTGIVVFLPILLEVAKGGLWQRLDITFPSTAAALAIIFLAFSACLRNDNNEDIHARYHHQHMNRFTYDREERINVKADQLNYDNLDAAERELLDAAVMVRQRAYVPYSHFKVGSAVRSADGEIYVGCNIENAAYGSTNCAERSALFHAISRGASAGSFTMLAVVGDVEQPITPCGACRQVIAELCRPDMPVILANLSGQAIRTSVQELLPGAFTDTQLKNVKDRELKENEDE